jgi:putative DNA primase/helicase
MTTTIPDTDRATLEQYYTLDAQWFDEARIVTTALLADEKPDLCKRKPWSTHATYMAFGNNPVAQFNKANATLPADAQRAIAFVIADCAKAQRQPQQTADDHKPTDDELRDRWLKRNRLTAYGMGDWRVYNSGVWAVVADTTIEQQIMHTLEDAKSDGIRPTSHLLGSVAKLAQVRVFKPAEVWDADPDLLVCENGMLHIPSGELRAHDPDAYQTTGVPYAYDPAAQCPAFLDALTRLPYRVVQFLQEFAGYCLTTDTRHEIAVWFLGSPGSGKSTIIEGFNAMLGERAGVLSLKQISQSRFGLSNIEGKTLIYAFESPALYLETTDILNAIVSGEAIPVERKYRDPVTVIPRAKILWAMNKLPRIQDAGDGIFRRVQIVRFDPLPYAHRNPTVKEQIKTEGPGILNWALAGLARLRNRGYFQIPPEIRQAVEEFQEGNDPESAFVRECCTVDTLDPDLMEQSSYLYDAYKSWCYQNGHKAKSSTSVANEWRRLGFTKSRQSLGVFWQGVELLQQFHP